MFLTKTGQTNKALISCNAIREVAPILMAVRQPKHPTDIDRTPLKSFPSVTVSPYLNALSLWMASRTKPHNYAHTYFRGEVT
jgi:hypothetical protein